MSALQVNTESIFEVVCEATWAERIVVLRFRLGYSLKYCGFKKGDLVEPKYTWC